jgi:hypothetical protein
MPNAILLAGNDKQRTADIGGDTFQTQRCSVSARLVLRLAARAHAESFARQVRQSVPAIAEIVWSRKRDARLDAFFERCRARRVISAERHAP